MESPPLVKEMSSSTTSFQESSEESDDGDTYCLCKSFKPRIMVACDNPQCLIEWYHLSRDGLTVEPDGDWYCPFCQ